MLGGIDPANVRALYDVCDALRDDPDVRAIALANERWDATFEGIQVGDAYGFLADIPQPVIAAASGDVAGAGLALALASDIRISADHARFAITDLQADRLPPGGVIARLTQLIGAGNATHMLLTGESVDAAEALRLGLVGEIVPSDRLLERAKEIAERIAERGPLAVRYAKEAVQRGLDMPLEQALRFETDLTVILQTTEDRAEGVRAFLDKRKPEFKGK